jgi:ABC-2 type transport system ATP-binding protein
MSENKKVAISIQNVSKDFKLPHHNQPSSIKSIFINPFRSKDDKATSNYNEKQHALRDISFDVYEGEFFGIVGKNGSGKSTLLKIIAGIYRPNNGRVHYNGKLVPFIELGVGFNPELTGRDNIYLSGALMGFSPREINEKYQKIVEFAELERFMDQLLKNYSSGMQVRLAFSVATILGDSDILLIDEVLAVGDADFQRKCFEYFKKLKKNNKTVVFVSHDMNAVREYCDRAILVDESKLVFAGSSDDTAKEYSRLFLPKVGNGHNNRTRAAKWGVGGADMRDVTIKDKAFSQAEDFIKFEYNIHADKGYEDELLVGFVVKDEQGQLICGTNNNIIGFNKKIKINDKKPIRVSWKIPNMFNDGKFTIDIAMDSVGSGELVQWWDEAASFRVINEEKTPYLVAPKITLSVDG